MTNRKIKDYQRNEIARLMITENYKNLCRLLVVLNKLYPKQFYPKAICEWLDLYAARCGKMNKYDAAGVYDIKINEFAEDYNIDKEACLQFVVKNNPEIRHHDNKILLAHNMMLALIETCEDFGIGEKRLDIITQALLISDIKDPLSEMKDIGLEVDVTNEKIDYRELKPKKPKETTYAEMKAAYKDLEGLKAYQEYMRNSGEINE